MWLMIENNPPPFPKTSYAFEIGPIYETLSPVIPCYCLDQCRVHSSFRQELCDECLVLKVDHQILFLDQKLKTQFGQ